MSRRRFDPRQVRRILAYVRPYLPQVALALFFILAVTLLANLIPLVFKYAVDAALAPKEPKPLEARYQALVLAALVFLGLKLGESLFRFAEAYLLAWIGQKVLYDLRRDLFDKLMRLHVGYFDRTPTGRVLTRMTSDVDAIHQFITGGLVGFAADLFMLVGILGFMFWLDVRLALIAFWVVPPLFVLTTWLRARMRAAYRVMRRRLSEMNSFLAENLAGVLTIQLFAKEERQLEKFEEKNQRLLASHVEVIRWFAPFFPVVAFSGELAAASVLHAGGGEVIRGAVSLGLLVAFLDYTRNFFEPLRDLSDKFNIFQSAMAAAERIFELLDAPEEVKDAPDALPVEKLKGEIRFEDVWFAYEDENWVLKGVSFAVRPGEKVALVGHTGAGKTSVINLIARFYDVQKGRVLLDGVDVRRYRQRDLRRALGIVMQEPFLFSGTIEENLRLGDDSIPEGRIWEALELVGLAEAVRRRGGLKVELGERGAGFSTGERQLLALARALLHNPDLLLILDEATANVDSETERKMQEALRRVSRGRTTVVIAHRLSTVRDADRILVFRRGELVEEGSHEELLQKGGYYARLYQLALAS